MKLRIKGDSLRLRLTRTEVEELATTGKVEDRIRFGADSALVYRLNRDAPGAQMTASFAKDAIEVSLPAAAARHWCSTDEVTLAGVQSSGGVELKILVEKDFACLKPREDEDESDHFPHPQMSSRA